MMGSATNAGTRAWCKERWNEFRLRLEQLSIEAGVNVKRGGAHVISVLTGEG